MSETMHLLTTEQEQEAHRAKQRVAMFEQRYGPAALGLARYAAFPMTLTSQLLYCLRENGQKFTDLVDVPWYAAADILLSGLCQPVGFDLYEMAGAVRMELLRGLSPQQIRDLSDFMAEYIALNLEGAAARSRGLGEPEWTVLACLQPGKLLAKIATDVRRLWQEEGNLNHFHWSAMMEGYGAMLPELQPPLVRWADDLAAGQLIEYQEEEQDWSEWAAQYGIRLERQRVEVATIRFDNLPAPASDFLDPNVLREFEFEVVTLDARGQEKERQKKTARYFLEPLGEIADRQVPCLEMVAIPGDKFLMGSPDGEGHDDEKPQHEVTVSPFFMGKYPVTQAQWRAVAAMPKVAIDLEAAPLEYSGDDLPIVRIEWLEAQEFCQRLTNFARRQDGKMDWVCRLPTEAEWEYACRAGTTTPFHFGETISAKFANYDGNSTYGQGVKGEYRQRTASVGSFKVANNFGLYDMHGNVWEWCADDWHDNYKNAPEDGLAWIDSQKERNSMKMLRGGSWFNGPNHCRASSRLRSNVDLHNSDIGFRVVYAPARAL